MDRCVIYARVSTKEQQDEGYSIPAQLKAIRAFCASQGLSPAAEFIEAESAGKAGRKRFTEMVDFLKGEPGVRIVVAHKLDRLYRNFTDQVLLEEIVGARARYVTGDVPDSPQGELLRDVQLSVAKFYLGNLAEEVRKGMDEKVLQGGWPHRAPLGYLNDKPTRTIVLDPLTAPPPACSGSSGTPTHRGPTPPPSIRHRGARSRGRATGCRRAGCGTPPRNAPSG